MGSGASKSRIGAFRGTGALLNQRKVGFRPNYVHLINVSSSDELTWIEGMADAAGYKRVAAGTGSVITTGGITPLADGFSLGTDADMNVSGETVRFHCTD
jgi:hypothetical protein